MATKEALESQPLEGEYGKPGLSFEYQEDGACLIFNRPSFPIHSGEVSDSMYGASGAGHVGPQYGTGGSAVGTELDAYITDN